MKNSLLTIVCVLFLSSTINSQTIRAISVNLIDYQQGVPATMDGVAVLFGNYSDSVDLDDALKIMNPNENIYILRHGTALAGEKRTSRDTIPLYLESMNLSYTHAFDIKTINEDGWILQDTRLNRIYPINDSLHTLFISWYDDNPCRFRLIYIGNPLLLNNNITAAPTLNEIKEVTIYPNPSKGDITIKAPQGKYTVSFRGNNMVKSFNHIGIIKTELPNGMYHVVVADEFGRAETKLVWIEK